MGKQPNHSRGNGNHKETNRCYGKHMVGKTYDYDKGTIRKVSPTHPNEKFPKSIISVPKEHKAIQHHPTQKPVALLEYLIKTYSNEGDTILDNCSGSGTTAIAAIRTKRNFIGFELQKEYFDIANKRIREEQMQLNFDF